MFVFNFILYDINNLDFVTSEVTVELHILHINSGSVTQLRLFSGGGGGGGTKGLDCLWGHTFSLAIWFIYTLSMVFVGGGTCGAPGICRGRVPPAPPPPRSYAPALDQSQTHVSYRYLANKTLSVKSTGYGPLQYTPYDEQLHWDEHSISVMESIWQIEELVRFSLIPYIIKTE